MYPRLHTINWNAKLSGFLQTMAFCLAITALNYSLRPHDDYATPLTYSVLIGFFSWGLISFGAEFFPSAAETGFPKGWQGLFLSAGGIVGGCTLGWLSASLLLGKPLSGSIPQKHLLPEAVMSIVIGIIITFYFYSRGKSSHLEGRIKEVRHQASEAQLKLLQTQLEPHMLFNTLANLRALISVDPARAQTMLDHMVAYLRATLNASRATAHPLQAEFQRLRDYLELMAVRMGPRLRYTLDLPAELEQLAVPTLLLQPLVENAIKHGLEPQVAGGSILVRARQHQGVVTLEVTDTGVGLSNSAPQLTSNDTSSPGTGFGLAQVHERLATVYGPRAAMQIEAVPTGGTRVSVTFPSPSTP
ncbi:sensor histidine kinase [Rhodoferax aquaticus]|uniref:histidine kinase n=1 Tax=Rhodoferax aquaticus TaxID=2527691 RepID=A0A515EQR8_9BURK|nr:histidine kinase [Rhodoferax aquaticus]QDL55018.1 sensor histidine kinase [Rhodoferax aquaticus]